MTESKRKLKSNELWKKEKGESRTPKAKAQNIFCFSRSVQKEDTQLTASGYAEQPDLADGSLNDLNL